MDEGGAYARAQGHFSENPEDCLEDQDCEYRDRNCAITTKKPPAGETQLIFENSYIT